MMDISKSLLQARQGKGLSQRALAAKLGVVQSHIAKLEGGKVDMRLSSLQDAARALGLELMLVPIQQVRAVEAVLNAQKSVAAKPAYALDDDFEGNGAGEGASADSGADSGAGSSDGSGWG